jgi:two-component system LytT family response regulator
MTGYQPVSSSPYLQSAAENESALRTIHLQRRLERIPIRRRDDIILLPVKEIASIVADGELLKLTTIRRQTFTINHRLKDLESRLDPDKFIRLSRGTIANIDLIQRISPMPGGTYIATLETGEELQISRLQGRTLRDSILKL